MVLKKICERRGDSTLISTVILIITVVASLVLIISYGALTPKATVVSSMADNVATMVAEDGAYGQTEQQAAQSYLKTSGLTSATVTCDHSGTIQQGTQFTVTVSAQGTFGIGTIGVKTVPIARSSTMRSGVYTKGDG